MDDKKYQSKINWTIFFSATLLVFINFFVSLTILPQYVLEIGGTLFQSGSQNTLFFITAVVLRFYFGPFADRKGRKVSLLIGAFVFATTPVFFLFSPGVPVILLARVYQAIGLATFLASGSSLVAELSPQGKTGTYLGAYRVVMALSLLVGPWLALFMIDKWGYQSWFLLSISMGILSFVLMTLVQTPVYAMSKDAGSLTDVVTFFKGSDARGILAYCALVAFAYGAILTYAVTYVAASTAVPNPGIFFIYFSVGSIAANVSIGRLSDRIGRKKVVAPMLILLGIGNISLLFISYSPAFLVLSGVLTGTGIAGSLLVLIASLIDIADFRIRTSILSLQESTLDLASALGPLLVGSIGIWAGLAPSFALIGIMMLVPAVAAVIVQSKKRMAA